MTRPRAALFWSGGKDSAMALDRLRRGGDYEIVSLITTINPDFGRVSMHGVREALVAAQAEAAGLPLARMYVGSTSTNDAYVAALREVLAAQKAQGVEAVVFGDIFLADLRAWREGLLAEQGIAGVFPLWGENTRSLAAEFVAGGFKAVTCCVDDARLDAGSVGRALDAAFFAGLPAGVDPCGENGEYHTFVHDGPVFRQPVRFEMGETVYRPLGIAVDEAAKGGTAEADDPHPSIPVPAAPAGTTTRGFWFVDLLPGG
jgi:uncharacterized protein (TIGR00290 family)